jgi:hypothetical protein
MILSKFSPGTFFQNWKAFCLQILALSLFSCSKSANSNGNKAYVALTHVAYRVGALNLVLNGDSLLPSRLTFGNTSGRPGYPYDTATSRVSEMQLIEKTVLLTGNAAFQQGLHYSIFAYDTLDINTIALLILQDNPAASTDTSASFRFLNFSPGSKIGVEFIFKSDITIQDTIHISVRDTMKISPAYFVGFNPSPAAYPFAYRIHYGENQVFAWADSLNPPADRSLLRNLGTITIDTLKAYNIYLQGYFHPSSGPDSLQIKQIQLD